MLNLNKFSFITIALLTACSTPDATLDDALLFPEDEAIRQPEPIYSAATAVTRSAPSTAEISAMSSDQPRYDMFKLHHKNTNQFKQIQHQSATQLSIFQDPKLLNVVDDVNENIHDDKTILTAGCLKYCGEGYFYDRPGAKNDGAEIVCTKYPLKCGYKCTHGWNFRYLVDGSNYTCQEARQTPLP